MEIDVRQRNQRSIKRRERAQRMQAERESSGQGAPLHSIVGSDVGTGPTTTTTLRPEAAAGLDATSGDSGDDEDLLLLPPKRSPPVISGIVRRHKKQSSGSGTGNNSSNLIVSSSNASAAETPVSGVAQNNLGSSSATTTTATSTLTTTAEAVLVAAVVGAATPTVAATVTATAQVTMKEEVAVDWLKMEPRLMAPEENGGLGDEMEGDMDTDDSPLLEEDVIDGFAILAFKTYEDLEYAIKIANNRNEKRLSAITELTSTMTISKMSNGNLSLEDENEMQQRANLVRGEENASNTQQHSIGNGGVVDGSSDHHHQNHRREEDTSTTADDAVGVVEGGGASLKIDTGQGVVDRGRDWPKGNKMGHNHLMGLINSNSSHSTEGATSGLTGASEGAAIRSNHNHLQQPPITGNLVNNKTSNNIHVSNNSMAQDPSASDDSGRASERLISTSSGAPRDADSSRDRLSDASSRCSSGKGYICDSEGDDDKASDGSSPVGVFPPSATTAAAAVPTTSTVAVAITSNSSSSSTNNSTTNTTTTTVCSPGLHPTVPRKSDFPTTGLPLNNGPLGMGGSASPVPLPATAPPAPSPAPAALPPPSLPYPSATAPILVSNGPLAAAVNSNMSLMSGAPPRPLSSSSGPVPLAPPPPNSTNSISPSSNTNNSSNSSSSNSNSSSNNIVGGTANSTMPSESKAKPMGAPSLNGTASSTASPLKSGVPTTGGDPYKAAALNGYGPGSPSNGHLTTAGPTANAAVPSVPVGHYVGPGGLHSHSHSHLPLHHHLHQHTVGLAQPPTATAPTASAPIIHPPPPSLDSAAAATGRTNSPAVATSANHSAAASPLLNGSSLNPPPVTSMPSGMPPLGLGAGGPLGMLNSAPSPGGGVLMGTSTGPPPPPIPTLPYGHRGAGMVPASVSSMYPNFALYYANLPNPYLSPMASGPLPPISLVPSSVAVPHSMAPVAASSSSSPASPSSRYINSSSFSINKLTSSTPPSATTTIASMSANGSAAATVSSKSSNRLNDLKSSTSLSSSSSSSSAGLRPGSPATHGREMLTDHMHHLQHYGQPPSAASAAAVLGGQPGGPLTSHHTAAQRTAHSPRGHSPNRERDSYSSNVSSLSRSSVPPYGAPGGNSSNATGQSPALPGSSSLMAVGTPPGGNVPSSVANSSSLSYPKSTWSSPLPSTATTPVATPRPTPPPSGPNPSAGSSMDSTAPGGTSFPAGPLFAAPLPPTSLSGPTSTAIQTTSTGPPPPPNAHPFSAEVLFQTNQADLLRRELDNRFLDRSGAAALTPGGPFMRQEMPPHHQHQHTHLHQQIMPPAPSNAGPMFHPQQSSLFKDMSKLGESPFYRSALGGMASYPGYASSLLHPGLSGPTPFMPPSHMAPFAPKQSIPHQIAESKPKQGKTGLWNAMHVRIAWEIYHHQTKQNPDKGPGLSTSLSSLGPPSVGGGVLSSGGGGGTVNPKPTDPLLRPPSHMFPSSSALARSSSHELAASYAAAAAAGRPFEQSQLPPSFLGSPAGHLASPFSRYGSPFGASPFGGLQPFPRDLPIGTPLSVHDAWRSSIPRSVGSFPPPGGPPGWPLKPDPSLDAAAAVAAARRETEEQREREQRERERREQERQRREREERERERQKEREKEEKLRKEQERERERERERREKERRDSERRDSERREMERERMLQQQRDSAKQQQQQQQQVQRDRSPLRNGLGDPNDLRIKDEPRKDDPTEMMRYHHHQMHPYMTAARHFAPPPHLGRQMMPPSLGPPPMSHFAPPPPHGHPGWPMLDPYRDPYAAAAFGSLRYNPLMEQAMSVYSHAHTAHLRAKEPSPIPPPSSGPSPHHRSPLGGPPNGKIMPGGPPQSQQQQQQQQAPPMTNGMGGMDGKKEDPMR